MLEAARALLLFIGGAALMITLSIGFPFLLFLLIHLWG